MIVLSYVFFMLGNGIVSLTNPDEVFYAQTAKEMMQHHSWMTPFLFGHPQFEKPVLTYWLLRVGFVLFGVSSFSARFFPALFAMVGVLAVYGLGILGFKNENKAFLSGILLLSCGLYLGLARTVFTDMIFSIFILLSLLSFFWGHTRKNRKDAGILLFFAFCGLAVLTKGPLGLLIPLLIILVFLWKRQEMKFLFCKSFLGGVLIFLFLSLPWYILMIKKYGNSFTYEFFYNDHLRRIVKAEHPGNDRWYFYPLSMIGCMFPWSLYVVGSLASFFKKAWDKNQPICGFLICWLGAVFLIFQFAHSKLVSYIFPLFPALALMAGDFIYNQALEKRRPLFLISLGTALFFALIPIGLNIALSRYPGYLSSKIPLYSLMATCLVLSLSLVFLTLRRKLMTGIYLLALSNFLILSHVAFVHKDIEPYLSSRPCAEYLLKNFNENNTILCSKPFLRGVRYYTDRDVAVFGNSGGQFFSPHTVAFIDTQEKLKDLLRSQGTTLCVLKKSAEKDMERLVGQEFRTTTLKVIGNQYIVKISPLPE